MARIAALALCALALCATPCPAQLSNDPEATAGWQLIGACSTILDVPSTRPMLGYEPVGTYFNLSVRSNETQADLVVTVHVPVPGTVQLGQWALYLRPGAEATRAAYGSKAFTPSATSTLTVSLVGPLVPGSYSVLFTKETDANGDGWRECKNSGVCKTEVGPHAWCNLQAQCQVRAAVMPCPTSRRQDRLTRHSHSHAHARQCPLCGCINRPTAADYSYTVSTSFARIGSTAQKDNRRAWFVVRGRCSRPRARLGRA